MNNIPKVAHLYWDRGPMSWLQSVTIDTFIKYNPEWGINVYIPKQVYVGDSKYIPDYVGEDFFWRVESNPIINIIEVDLDDYGIRTDLHNILRSDILRYHLLYDIGGLWSDFDVIWLKPIEALSSIATTSDFNVALCLYENGNTFHHNISILLSTQFHPFYKEIIDQCNFIQYSLHRKPEHQEYGTTMFNELYPSTDLLLSKYKDMVKLKYNTFFPYSIFEMERLYKTTDLSVLTDDVVCVHWFNGHTLSKEYVNTGGINRVCSMSAILKNESLI